MATLIFKIIMNFIEKKYPEHEKFLAVSDDSKVIFDFLNWFMNKKK